MQLHTYQSYAKDFIIEHPSSAVFLSMGLGKTVITLSAINDLLFDHFEIQKVLVIAPLRVARDSWADEIHKWEFLKHIRYSVAIGDEAERLRSLRAKADVYIINRENVTWLVEDSQLKFDFDMIVIDELSSFKSYQAKRFRSLMKVRSKVKRVVGLTGTPASNGLMDLWAEFKILDNGQRLGRFITKYRDQYFSPDKRNGNIIYSYKLREGAEQKIYEAIKDITISMKALDMIAMPKLVTVDKVVRLNQEEMDKYKELKKELCVSLEGKTISALNATTLSSKLMQFASGFVYSDEQIVEVHKHKLEALEDLIEASNGESLLVAYWFKADKQRLEKMLTTLGVSYSILDSKEGIEAYKSRKVQVGLIHPVSAGHGLNIQSGGSTLVWYSVPWSLELYEQTVARLYRQGQKARSVVVIHLVVEDTIEQRIVKAISEKRVVEDLLLEAVKAEIGD